ncbi:GRAM domain-containing protein 2B isoform X7 [Monodelphis domestica]|uniref:GRAM domain-containing protein 2B isoform X7 n=1 Tax=Monodelphis domestica TaxID=13616 RepID=UPI0024E20F65|nr:GRAM domain-containing protein 2B isoform X7 [Monodelphis domestica]
MVKKRQFSSDNIFHFEGVSSQTTVSEELSPADSPGSVFLSSEAENGVEEKKRVGKSSALPTPTSSEIETLDQKKITCLRSKTSSDGLSLVSDSRSESKTDNKNDSKAERKKSYSTSQYKANMHFHKLFLQVPSGEPLRQSFTCALQKEILYQGKLFISENWICFHSKVFGKDIKICIPALSVSLIKKTKTALLVPNALIISTVTEKYIFVSLLSRDTTYKLIKSVCRHLENTSVGNSPNPSSPENSFRADRPSSLPLDFNDEFSDLDGVVQQRRQAMNEYSSSGSQTPESENSQGQSRAFGLFHKLRFQKCLTLRHILIFYAIVVCTLVFSTFYMRHRINTLEERLRSITSVVGSHNEQKSSHSLGSQLEVNVEALCAELTANIIKLEKIQSNLQRLLETGD